ncbi:hypothetical protein [Peribacillus deserti]|uniref:Uncharacterized protein n=1 Tax=Peribacillus deserti TaxID=673318 RepID=A0A2N5M3C9_9BACI|nr:hypothetical protein [Peribacillus deserti]PLT28868.1 hypothetical protein CUU66_16095 [Peribacillus deserti]
MYRIIISQIIVICTFVFTTHNILAAGWEDENTPISFKLELLPWEEATQLIPKKTKFTLIDVETGLHFKVQRRAGNQHADVQPLTVKDTKIMKNIYGGNWSWKRRAVIVLVNDQMIAASMHGMPHGAGALQNKFPGHFCVHFYGSTTHRLKNEDPIHKLMIMKAAGKEKAYLYTLEPDQMIELLTKAINMRDSYLLKTIIPHGGTSACFKEQIKHVSYMSLLEPAQNKKDAGYFLAEVPVQAAFYSKKYGKQNKKFNIILTRYNVADGWQIKDISLCDELDIPRNINE